MKFIEITGGLMVPVSNDEMIVMERVRGHGEPLLRKELNERERELARQLVFRGVLDRAVIEGKVYYSFNDVGYAERD